MSYNDCLILQYSLLFRSGHQVYIHSQGEEMDLGNPNLHNHLLFSF